MRFADPPQSVKGNERESLKMFTWKWNGENSGTVNYSAVSITLLIQKEREKVETGIWRTLTVARSHLYLVRKKKRGAVSCHKEWGCLSCYLRKSPFAAAKRNGKGWSKPLLAKVRDDNVAMKVWDLESGRNQICHLEWPDLWETENIAQHTCPRFIRADTETVNSILQTESLCGR